MRRSNSSNYLLYHGSAVWNLGHISRMNSMWRTILIVLFFRQMYTVLSVAPPESRLPSPSIQKMSSKDREIVKRMEASLLSAFGLKSRPRPITNTQIPQHMKDLYDFHSNQQRQPRQRGFISSNTVRSFVHTGVWSYDAECDGVLCVRMWFNVSAIPDDEVLAAAELRVFKDVTKLIQAKTGHSEKTKNKQHRVEIYEIMRPPKEGTDVISRLINTKVVDLKSPSSWDSLEVHTAVLKWKKNPRLNFGLEVRLITSNHHVTTDSHVRLRRSSGISESEWEASRPLLVVYTNDKNGPKPRSRRNSKRRKERKKKRKSRRKKNLCRRHTLYVDFHDVGWNDWIVAPAGYDAFYCHGDCSFPLPHHVNATNHATVQTMLNSMSPSAVPKACCVPTELTAISMLYLDEDNNIVLKNYQDMVVEACGCR